jgi:hypothetical protein
MNMVIVSVLWERLLQHVAVWTQILLEDVPDFSALIVGEVLPSQVHSQTFVVQ